MVLWYIIMISVKIFYRFKYFENPVITGLISLDLYLLIYHLNMLYIKKYIKT
jgi:hypothetical protein